MSRRPSVRPSVRKAAIFELVEQRGQVSVDELVDKFDTSPETVRRDLNALADAGRVRKVHGGVLRISPTEEGPFTDRLALNSRAKQIVAEKLAKTVPPDQSLLIDTGSTTFLCAVELANISNLTVITNSTKVASVISGQPNCSKVILLGGMYRHDNAQTVGSTTVTEIGQFRADQAILTIGTLDARGATNFSEAEAQVARAMIEAAEHVTIVSDFSKLGRRSTFHVCELQQIDRLILDKKPDAELQVALDAACVEVL